MHEHPLKAMLLITISPAPTLQSQPQANPMDTEAGATKWSAELSHFVSKALELDPSKRSSANQLLIHPWMRVACTDEGMVKFLSSLRWG
jgi:serine/threonine protein kinase